MKNIPKHKPNFEIGKNLADAIIWSTFWLSIAIYGLGSGSLLSLSF